MYITVASGKGGTGKTTVSTSLTASISENIKVTHVDLDVEEPDSNIFLKVPVQKEEMIWLPLPSINMEKCTFCGVCQKVCAYSAIFVYKNTQQVKVFDELCRGCGACYHMCPFDAINEVQRYIGVMSTGQRDNITFYEGRLNIGEYVTTDAIRWVKRKVLKENPNEITVIDAPPGTSCPVIHSMKDADYIILVTEDTPFGLFDLKIVYNIGKKMHKKMGIIVNKALPDYSDVDKFAALSGIPILLKIPFDRKYARAYANGITLPEFDSKFRIQFENLFAKIKEEVQ